MVFFISKESIPHRKHRLYTFGFIMWCPQANDTWLYNQILPETTMHNHGPNNGPNGISFTSVGTSCEERLATYYYASRRGLSFCITLMCRFMNFDYLGSARIQCYSKQMHTWYKSFLMHMYFTAIKNLEELKAIAFFHQRNKIICAMRCARKN